MTKCQNAVVQKEINITRWLYCVECPVQYSNRLEALGYMCDCTWVCTKITSGQSNLLEGASPP